MVKKFFIVLSIIGLFSWPFLAKLEKLEYFIYFESLIPSTLVLFGARGNLSRIKLIPGLFNLDQAGKLSDEMKIVSVGRQKVSQKEWESEIKNMLDKKFNKKLSISSPKRTSEASGD